MLSSPLRAARQREVRGRNNNNSDKDLTMSAKLSASRLVCGCLLALFLAACDGGSNDNKYAPLDVASPTVEGPIAGTPGLLGTLFEFADVGYEQSEYFFGGTATSYTNANVLKSDGKWQVLAADTADYKSRMVVYRPTDPAKFNGTVVVEWLNVTAGADGPPEWVTLHTELIRRGYAWVGVSAQRQGVEGGDTYFEDAFAQPLKISDPERYGSLSHPGDSFSYDIFSQAIQALRHPGSVAPLGDLTAQRVIAAGESQSAYFLTTYVDAIGKRTDLIDGYFIHSRVHIEGVSAAPLSQAPQADVLPPDVLRIRADLGKPVLVLQTESDVLPLGTVVDRQDDSDTFRLWEVPGTAHADIYISISGRFDLGDDPSVAQVQEVASPAPGFIECDKPVNSGPLHFVANAALAALNRWLADGVAPPMAQRLALNEAGEDYLYDDLGNVLGGVRTPYVDAPVARFSGSGQGSVADGSVCALFGTTELLDEPTLLDLYPDHQAYVVAVTDAANAAVADGFLLEEDAQLIIQAADDSFIPYDGATP